VLRDPRDGLIGNLPIEERELYTRRYAEIEIIADLRLVDLRDDHAVRMGVPTDVAKSSRQSPRGCGSWRFMSMVPRKMASSIHPA
jgi:hypothetical protein